MSETIDVQPTDAALPANEIKSTIPICPPGTVRQVFNFEILKYKKPRCSLCHGQGVYSFTLDPKVPVVETICGCAMRKFARFHIDHVVLNETGQIFWREGHDPKAEEISAVNTLLKTDSP